MEARLLHPPYDPMDSAAPTQRMMRLRLQVSKDPHRRRLLGSMPSGPARIATLRGAKSPPKQEDQDPFAGTPVEYNLKLLHLARPAKRRPPVLPRPLRACAC